MLGLRLIAAFSLALGVACAAVASAHAQQHTGSLGDLARAGAPLMAAAVPGSLPSEPPSPAAASPLAPELTAPLDPLLPNPLDLIPSLNPIDWATDLIEAVLGVISRAILEAVRGFTDWAMGVGGSSMNFVTRTPPELTYQSSAVRALWEMTRAVAFAGLGILVAWSGFNVIFKEHLRAPYHGVLELLPRIALAAVASSLTLQFTALLIDANNAFSAAIGTEALPGYDEAGREQDGLALVLVTVAYAVVALLLAFQMLMRLALLNVLLILGPVMVLLWVVPQTQSWTRWWTALLPTTVFQQAVQMLTLRLGTLLMTEFTGPEGGTLLTLLVGIAVCWLTLKVPSLLRSQVQHTGTGSVNVGSVGHAAGSAAHAASGAAHVASGAVGGAARTFARMGR